MNNNFLHHVYVVNPQQISAVVPSCISICDVVPINVSVTNPISVSFPSCISICDVVPINVSVTNPCISICNTETTPINVNIDKTSSIDAGGVQQWDADFVDGNLALLWDTSTTGSATVTDVTAQAARSLNTTTASGDIAIVQGRQRQLYQLGTSKRIIVGGLLGAKKTNVTKRIGFFDSDDGVFFQQTGTTLSIVTRTSASGAAVDTVVPQASWNIDPLDGTGPSGLTLDETKIQFFIIEYDYHGAGRAFYGFRLENFVIYVHKEDFANVVTLPFIARPTLPVRCEIRNTAAVASATSLKIYSASVISFSTSNPLHIDRTIDLNTSGKSVTTTLTPLLSVRLKSAFNKNLIKVSKINLFVGSGSVIRWVLIFNPTTLTAPTYVSIASDSIGEFDEVATNVTGGTEIASGYFDNNNGVLSDGGLTGLYLLSSNIAGTADVMTLAAQRVAGTATVYASLGLEEYKR